MLTLLVGLVCTRIVLRLRKQPNRAVTIARVVLGHSFTVRAEDQLTAKTKPEQSLARLSDSSSFLVIFSPKN